MHKRTIILQPTFFLFYLLSHAPQHLANLPPTTVWNPDCSGQRCVTDWPARPGSSQDLPHRTRTALIGVEFWPARPEFDPRLHHVTCNALGCTIRRHRPLISSFFSLSNICNLRIFILRIYIKNNKKRNISALQAITASATRWNRSFF